MTYLSIRISPKMESQHRHQILLVPETPQRPTTALDFANARPSFAVPATPAAKPQPQLQRQPKADTSSSHSSHAVRVFLRLRRAAAALPRVLVAAPGGGNKIALVSNEAEVFSFDEVFAEDADDEHVFRTAALPLLVRLVETETETDELIMAYGPSGSGKTHTLDRIIEKSLHFLLGRMDKFLNGIQPQSASVMPVGWNKWGFIDATHAANKLAAGEAEVCTLWMSVMEIYNDKCFDLLEEATSSKPGKQSVGSRLRVIDGNPVLKNSKEIQIRDYRQAMDLIKRVNAFRETAETKVNRTSSRGHLITTLKLLRFSGDSKNHPIISRISIADLAGSENSKKTGAEGETLKEAGEINQSLFHLSECVKAMVRIQKSKKTSATIPFRNNQLTVALQPFFRNGLVTFVFHVNPANEEQTKMALDFSQQSCQLVTYHPTISKPSLGSGMRDDLDLQKAIYEREILRLNTQVSHMERERDASLARTRDMELARQELSDKMHLLLASNASEEEHWKTEYLRMVEENLAHQRDLRVRAEKEIQDRYDFKVGLLMDRIEEMDAENEQKEIEYQQLQEEKENEISALETRLADVLDKNRVLMQQLQQVAPAAECSFCVSAGRELELSSKKLALLEAQNTQNILAIESSNAKILELDQSLKVQTQPTHTSAVSTSTSDLTSNYTVSTSTIDLASSCTISTSTNDLTPTHKSTQVMIPSWEACTQTDLESQTQTIQSFISRSDVGVNTDWETSMDFDYKNACLRKSARLEDTMVQNAEWNEDPLPSSCSPESVPTRRITESLVGNTMDVQEVEGPKFVRRRSSNRLSRPVERRSLTQSSSQPLMPVLQPISQLWASSANTTTTTTTTAPTGGRRKRTVIAALQAESREQIDIFEKSSASKATNISVANIQELFTQDSAQKGETRLRRISNTKVTSSKLPNAMKTEEASRCTQEDEEVTSATYDESCPKKKRRLRVEKTFLPPVEDSPAPPKSKKRNTRK
ncbi:P-loop containing nucleoside triphosphate hydrolase protein [Obelidium mucronatum]|nr:P-loop containing nucleoside triphosphate hydrolase protein [Obelidium mucronatum]